MKRFGIRKVAGFILLAVAGVFIFGNIVMLLWNALLPILFHFPVVSFWQALGLLLLAKILFGGFRGGNRFQGKRDGLRRAWRNMSPEEREQFKHEWGNRCKRGFEHDSPYTDTAKQEG